MSEPLNNLETELHKIFALCNDENCSAQCKKMIRKGMKAITAKINEAQEYAVKITIGKFLRMNIENPKAPVNVDEVKRRALEHLTVGKG